MILAVFQVNWFLSLFSDKPKTAMSWFFVSLAIGSLLSALLLGLKFFLKIKNGNPVWSRSRNWLFITLGSFPLPLLLLAMQFADQDYRNYSNYGGGALFAYSCYVFLILFTHLLYKDWRTELF
jgi:hypothetical protein